jgi:hypothetical protein
MQAGLATWGRPAGLGAAWGKPGGPGRPPQGPATWGPASGRRALAGPCGVVD